MTLKSKELFLQIKLDSKILDMKNVGMLRMPVAYARLVSFGGKKVIALVCTQYDLPATYTLHTGRVARWEGYCSENHPALYKKIHSGSPISLSALTDVLKHKFVSDNRIDKSKTLSAAQLEKLTEKNKERAAAYWKKKQRSGGADA